VGNLSWARSSFTIRLTGGPTPAKRLSTTTSTTTPAKPTMRPCRNRLRPPPAVGSGFYSASSPPPSRRWLHASPIFSGRSLVRDQRHLRRRTRRRWVRDQCPAIGGRGRAEAGLRILPEQGQRRLDRRTAEDGQRGCWHWRRRRAATRTGGCCCGQKSRWPRGEVTLTRSSSSKCSSQAAHRGIPNRTVVLLGQPTYNAVELRIFRLPGPLL
jgi:hypothetical protein